MDAGCRTRSLHGAASASKKNIGSAHMRFGFIGRLPHLHRAPTERQNSQRSVVITPETSAAGADVYAVGERLLDDLAAPTASLTSTSRIYCDDVLAGV